MEEEEEEEGGRREDGRRRSPHSRGLASLCCLSREAELLRCAVLPVAQLSSHDICPSAHGNAQNDPHPLQLLLLLAPAVWPAACRLHD